MPDSRSKTSLPFEVTLYEAHQDEIALHMSHFFLDYLREIYKAFEGDLALVIVLGEIAHHNLAVHFTEKDGLSAKMVRQLASDAATKDRMPSCNAYSLAQSTGLPRETIRRKMARLKELGWIEQVGRREVRITPKVGQHFMPDFNVRLLANLLQTADRVRGLLAS